MKNILEKLKLSSSNTYNIGFDSLLKAHIAARKEANNRKENYIVLKTKDSKYFIKPQEGHKIGDSIEGDDVIEIVKNN